MCQDVRQSALVCGQPEPSAPEHRTHLHARKSDATVHVAPASLRPCRSLFPTGLVSPGPRLPALAGLVPVPIPGLSLAPPPPPPPLPPRSPPPSLPPFQVPLFPPPPARARARALSLSIARSLARSRSLGRALSLSLGRSLSITYVWAGTTLQQLIALNISVCHGHVRVCVCAESNITATCRPQHGHQV